jgi:hypothetical protein
MPKIHKPWVSHEELDAFLGGGILDVLDHAAEHEVGGGDLLAFASIPDFGNWIDQAVKQASVVSFAGITDTGVTATNIAAGTIGQRPGGIVGDMRYNSTLGAFEVYTGAWGSVKISGSAPAAHAASHEPGGGDLVDALTFSNEGLHILDLGGDHDLIIKPGTDLSANRILTLTTGDAARTITLSGNPTLANWFDQTVKQAASPTFVTAKLSALTDGYIPYHVDDATGLANSPIFTDGTNVGVGTATPGQKIELYGDAALMAYNFPSATSYTGIEFNENDVVKGYILYIGSNFVTPARRNMLEFHSTGGISFWPDGGAADVIIDTSGWLGILKIPTCELDVNGTVKATLLQGNLHWDYITNEPTYYPPEYHYHVGKDIVSLHLVDLDDVEADDIFDVLPTAAIHGEGNYDWWGTWDTTAAANTSAEIVVLAGDDKMLRLTDNNNGDNVTTVLAVDAPHYMVTGVVQFQIREDAWGTVGVGLTKGGARNMEFLMIDDGVGARKLWFFNGTAEVELGVAYALDTWYTIRIHFDCVARAATIFVNNVHKKWTALSAAAICDYVDAIRIETDPVDTGYVVDVNNLKIFNLTI